MQLNNSKAKKILNWRAKLNINETIDFVVEWYKNFNSNKGNIFNISQKQILEFMEKKYESNYSCRWFGHKNERIYQNYSKAYGKN